MSLPSDAADRSNPRARESPPSLGPVGPAWLPERVRYAAPRHVLWTTLLTAALFSSVGLLVAWPSVPAVAWGYPAALALADVTVLCYGYLHSFSRYRRRVQSEVGGRR